ncbi:hypothetical protein D3C75_790640 [compost metagenome]
MQRIRAGGNILGLDFPELLAVWHQNPVALGGHLELAVNLRKHKRPVAAVALGQTSACTVIRSCIQAQADQQARFDIDLLHQALLRHVNFRRGLDGSRADPGGKAWMMSASRKKPEPADEVECAASRNSAETCGRPQPAAAPLFPLFYLLLNPAAQIIAEAFLLMGPVA